MSADAADAPAAPLPSAAGWRVGRPWKALLIIGIFFLVFDQGTKIWARHSLPVTPVGCEMPEGIIEGRCIGVAVPVIDGFWDWQMAVNLGSAFSMFAGKTGSRVGLSIVGVLALIGVGWMLKKSKPHQKFLMYGLALVASGAIGNLIDRIAFGGVTDFILWRYKTHRWPVFNIADVALVIGVVCILISSWREPPEPKPAKPARR